MVLLLVVYCAASTLASSAFPKKSHAFGNAEYHFKQFMRDYDKQYANDHERERRFQIFRNNLDIINRRSMDDDSAVHGITKFTDLTADEFLHMYGCEGMQAASASTCSVKTSNSFMSSAVPLSFDWRTQNKVTSVKDQARCGACWTFSVIGGVESKYSIKHNDLKQFSEQQLVDCDKSGNGCHGGHIDQAMAYLMNTGVMSYADYPYEGQETRQCKYDPSRKVASVTDCYVHQYQSEEQLKQILVDNGPLSIQISGEPLQIYRGGILKDCVWQVADHAVLLVGYGTEGNVPYWIVKNSWGTSWGENGYVKVKMNVCPMTVMVVSSDVA